jgi:hypothetical protein
VVARMSSAAHHRERYLSGEQTKRLKDIAALLSSVKKIISRRTASPVTSPSRLGMKSSLTT